jgi:hypothetical protein
MTNRCDHLWFCYNHLCDHVCDDTAEAAPLHRQCKARTLLIKHTATSSIWLPTTSKHLATKHFAALLPRTRAVYHVHVRCSHALFMCPVHVLPDCDDHGADLI